MTLDSPTSLIVIIQSLATGIRACLESAHYHLHGVLSGDELHTADGTKGQVAYFLRAHARSSHSNAIISGCLPPKDTDISQAYVKPDIAILDNLMDRYTLQIYITN